MSAAELRQRLAQLEQENTKLKRINAALISRVEAGVGQDPSAFAAFSHAVTLAEQVRERTDALNTALAELKISHQALQEAKHQAETSHQHLLEAIDSISDAFVLFDAQGRIRLFNRHFAAFWQHSGHPIQIGSHLNDMQQAASSLQLIQESALLDGCQVYHLRDGRWLQMREKPTRDGGKVVLYTDISALKARENARRELALAEQAHKLQLTLDNLSQGVALINPQGLLELANQHFLRLGELPPLQAGESFLALMHEQAEYAALLQLALATGRAQEYPQAQGRMLELQVHPLPDQSLVVTHTDITERHQHSQTLKRNEAWIRLITDNVPALIAYVGADLRYRFTNKVYDEWYGRPRGSLYGQAIEQVHPQAQMRQLLPFIEQALRGRAVTFEIDEGRGEQLRHMRKSYVPNRNSQGQVDGFFVMIQDISKQRRTALELQQAYSHLEQRVKERTAELTTLNQQLRQEIHERAEAEVRLRDATRAAEQANQSKTKFLAAVSHDLLQPLNAARLFTGALAEKNLAEELRPLVHSTSNALEDVESLLGSLVDISKLDAGVVKADITHFHLSELLDHLAHEYQHLAQQQGLRLHFVPCSAIVRTDSQLLARILRNLLSNALRYTPTGRVLLGCRRLPDAIRIEVWDSGLGIPAHKLQDIFHEFERLQRPQNGQDKGLGLGLAIVDKISKVLGHRISVHSQLGRGSTFAVEVPVGQQAALSPQQHLPQPDNERLSGARIWLVDNDQTICTAMQQLLSGWGVELCWGLSAAELLAKGRGQRPQLLIADYHLDHGEQGLDAVSLIQQQLGCALPVLMITANHSQELKEQIRTQGYRLLHKPVKPLKLKLSLIHLLEQPAPAST